MQCQNPNRLSPVSAQTHLLRSHRTAMKLSFSHCYRGPIQRSLPAGPPGLSCSTFPIALASDATASRVRVRFEGSRIRPACGRPCASRSAARGRKSLTLLVITARSAVAATSKTTRSLLPTRSSRSATATTSKPASRNFTAISGDSCSSRRAFTPAAPAPRPRRRPDPFRSRSRCVRSAHRFRRGTRRSRRRRPQPVPPAPVSTPPPLRSSRRCP